MYVIKKRFIFCTLYDYIVSKNSNCLEIAIVMYKSFQSQNYIQHWWNGWEERKKWWKYEWEKKKCAWISTQYFLLIEISSCGVQIKWNEK